MMKKSSFSGVALVVMASHGIPNIPRLPMKPGPPQRAVLHLIPSDSSCGDGYKVIPNKTTGAIQIDLENLLSEAKAGTYRASCRLNGEITVPKGYRLAPDLRLTGVVQGTLTGAIDNITGRLKFTLGRYVSRDFQLAEYSSSLETVKLELKAGIPELPLSCEKDVIWPVTLFVESTINGAAASSIQEMRLDGLTLLPADCSAPQPKD